MDLARLNILLELVTELADVSDLETLLRVTSARIGWLLAFERCTLVIELDEGARRSSWTTSGRGEPFAEIALTGIPVADARLIEQAMGTRRPVSSADGRSSTLCNPLLVGERALGAICFGAAVPCGFDDLRLCNFVAQHLASTVRRVEQTDTIERQAREAEANRFKDEFLAIVSHELRTPLNAILGWSEMLQQHGAADASKLARGLETIARNARLQARLIDDLVDVSRIVAGKLHFERERFPLAGAVRRAVETVEPLAAKKGVAIDVSIEEVDLHVVGDEKRVQQVVWNLLTNAVKFSPACARVAVEVRRCGEQARITVSDHGAGIDPATLAHVFERFHQGGPSRTRRHGGLGLGLAIAKHLVELHQGTITAESPGLERGATFVVSLPIAVAAIASPERGADHERRSERGERPARAELAGLRILCVDDEEDARQMLTYLLAMEGAVVVSAGSADAALDVLSREPIDLLVSDIGMPDRDGYMLLEAVREASAELPAIALTAFASGQERKRALSAGFVGYLSKPVEPRALVALLAQVARDHLPAQGVTRPRPGAPLPEQGLEPQKRDRADGARNP